ncbi:hypothetical protein EJ110_NYTH29266 [Nymphaea thermarum]|nr:hypothetical protein EJ110_NYTH29266 [Nymphaea thermarum]
MTSANDYSKSGSANSQSLSRRHLRPICYPRQESLDAAAAAVTPLPIAASPAFLCLPTQTNQEVGFNGRIILLSAANKMVSSC